MRKLLRRLPRPVRDFLRGSRKRYRSARYRARERLRPIVLTREDIARAFREAGLAEGDPVFFQASMAAFGTIEGGPATVIAALRDVIGDDALIAMPSFPLSGPAVEHLRSHPVFDSRTEPSRMGAVSEAFRRMPGTLRSLHPTHAFCAAGPGAEEVLAGHEHAATPFGEGTPFVRVRELGATQVFFGSGTRAITMYHSFEVVREPPFPFDVFLPEPVPARVIDAEGREEEVTTFVHDPRLAPGRIDVDPRLEADVRSRLIAGGMRSVALGRGEILAQPLAEMFRTFERMLGDGVTIYDPQHLRESLHR
jgi:aminoglycoside 3-N-acetyltransferase